MLVGRVMGFVGDSGNIAIVTALPLSIFVLTVFKFSFVYGIYSSYFYACMELRFPDVETNPGPGRLVPGACRILRINVRGLSRNPSNLTVASSQFDILLCSETLVWDRRHVSEFLVPGFGRPVLL